jgi:hypothetical protein
MWFSRLSVDLLWGIIAQFFYGEKKNGRLQKNISFEKWAIFGNFDGKIYVSRETWGSNKSYGVSRET